MRLAVRMSELLGWVMSREEGMVMEMSECITNACEGPGRWLSHYNQTPWSCFTVHIKLCSGREGRVSFLVWKEDEADSWNSATDLIILLNNVLEFPSVKLKTPYWDYSLLAKAVVKVGLRSRNLLGNPPTNNFWMLPKYSPALGPSCVGCKQMQSKHLRSRRFII